MSLFNDIKQKAADKAALYSSTGNAAQAGAGEFVCYLESAEVSENRKKDAKRVCLTYKVTEVIEGDAGDVGRTFHEYISDKSKDEMLQKKAAILFAELQAAGVPEDKIQDEEDSTYWDAIVTMVSYVGGKFLSKDCNKGKIRAQVKRVATDKLTENGKPYFNNYFNDDKLGEASADEVPADEKKDAKSPYLKD